MSDVIGVREFRNDISEILRRVESGESFEVTVRGRSVARVVGLDPRPRTMPAEVFRAALARAAADGLMADELRDAITDTTDDVNPWSD